MTDSPVPEPLHARLTVVRADAGSDATTLARHLATGLLRPGAAAGAVDLRPPVGIGPVVGADEIGRAAVEAAGAAFAHRVLARDEAIGHRTGLAARRTHLLERADWCEATAGTARALAAALSAAQAAVAAANLEVEAAATRCDRVAQQRAVARAAVEEARLELEGLDSANLDETGVRRELEAATRAERDAEEARAAAEAEVASLHDRLAELAAIAEELAAARASLGTAVADDSAAAAVEGVVRDALASYDELADRAGADPGATALSDALGRVEYELAELRRTLPEPPTDAQLDGAEADVTAARRRVDVARAAASSFDGPPPPWWVELNALHAEVVDAEMAVQRASLRRGAPRRRYEDALTAERTRLDELGFGSYLDALMSGGRLPDERATDDDAVAEATAALVTAERVLQQAQADRRAGAPLIEYLGERERLLHVAAGLLGCEPGDRAVELLNNLPAVPPMVIGELADALRTAGVPTTGIGLAEAARAWLDARAAKHDPARLADLDRRIRDTAAERDAVEQTLESAVAAAEQAAAATTSAARIVASLEAELRARAGDDGRLLERATAAGSLRDHIEAVEARLAAAESDALEAWAATGDASAAAEAERERVDRDLADLSRRATRAAGELPPERRPAFDIVQGLVPLAGALRAEASMLADTLAEAEAAVADADAAVNSGPGNPSIEDLTAGLLAVVARVARAGSPVVLAEPFEGVAADAVEPLLETLAKATDEHPAIVVTADLAVVGWAIGLPADIGALVPARSIDGLLTDPDTAPARAHGHKTTHPAVD